MKRWFSILSFGIMSLMLSGCQSQNTDSGFLHRYFVAPFTESMEFTAALFDGDYGIAIILITLAIRLVLLPFFIKMHKNQRVMKEKMDVLKLEMNKIQKKLEETKDPKEQQKIQQEMIQLYRNHDVNPLNMGCLPMFIQLPFLMGFYYAIRTSKAIASHNFLWFNLGHTDIFMAFIAFVVYLLQFLVSQSNLPSQQQKSMRFIGLISPVFILIVSLNYPSALALYWSVSGIFLIGQTLLCKWLYPPKEKIQTQEA